MNKTIRLNRTETASWHFSPSNPFPLNEICFNYELHVCLLYLPFIIAAIYCSDVPEVLNASPNSTNNLYSTVIEYTCDKGHYVYDGTTANHTVQRIQCQEDKTWEHEAQLQPCWREYDSVCVCV